MTPVSLAAGAVPVVAVLLALALTLLAAGTVRGELEHPTLTAGDRWVYILEGSMENFPGLNATQGTVELGLSGLVEVDVLGSATATVGGTAVPGVRTETQASGFLNGTFAAPGNTSIHASGTFSTDAIEIWEDRADLPVLSNATSSYVITVTFGIPFSLQARVWVNATTDYASIPPFNLSVGESASTAFTTEVSVETSATFFGITVQNGTRGSAAGVWTRQVLDEENVTVEAGTFLTYRLNQSLGSFPGIGGLVPLASANETAWFSNGVGSYALREAYVNGTPVAEMRLKSYTYPAAPSGLPIIDIVLFAAIPIAVVALVAFVLLRRRRKNPIAPAKSGSAGPVGELPPKPPGGGP